MKLTAEKFALAGLIGMFLTGPWSFQHDFAWTASALMTVPHALFLIHEALKGGGE